MREETYKSINCWFREKETRMKVFLIIYKILPLIIVASYGMAAIWLFYQKSWSRLLRVVMVPAITFLLCTVFRKVVNERRPYEVWDLKPLVKKEKKGQSFPSRHMLSATIIAMACLYVNQIFGICVMIIAGLVGAVRPVAGVHFVRDIVVAWIMGIAAGILGFYIIP